MAPIDYSKWDNIDTDSEPESPPAQPQAKKATRPIAPVPQPSVSAPATSGLVHAVIVRCEVDKPGHHPWAATEIPADHPVFSESVPPVPAAIDIPLVIHRVGTRSNNRADLDNQIATYLNIDLASGLAPAAWQSHVGTVIIARKDKKKLLPHHVEDVWMYCDRIADMFGDGAAPTRMYNRQAFERWWKNYCAEQPYFRRGRGGEMDSDDWRAVRSPFAN